MDSLTKTFETILGRKATAEESQEAFRIINAAGVSENDSFAILLLMFQAYMINYAAVPGVLKKEVVKILEEFKKTADSESTRSMAKAKSDLSTAVAKASTQVARKVTETQNFKWTAIASGVMGTALIGCLFAGFHLGLDKGYRNAIDDKAIASWANTRDGKEAFRLWQAGNIHDLANCSIKGWKEKDNTCYPGTVQEGKVSNMYGYQLRR